MHDHAGPQVGSGQHDVPTVGVLFADLGDHPDDRESCISGYKIEYVAIVCSGL